MERVLDYIRRRPKTKDKNFNSEGYEEIEQYTWSVEDEEDITEYQEREEWIWVEGVKGTLEDMTCKEYQYKMGELHTYEGDVEFCQSGFHFSLDIFDVFKIYSLDFYNRFFRVEALVKKSDYERASFRANRPFLIMGESTNLVTRKIVFMEELFFEDLKGYITREYPFVRSQDEYDSVSIEYTNYTNFAREKYMNKMKKLGFGETYATVKYGEISDLLELYHFLKSAEMFVGEGLGKDMLIYLLERENESRK